MFHTPIVCRSPSDIRDDSVTDAHSHICALLNEQCNGRLLWTGQAGKALVALRDQCEAFILGEGPMPDMLQTRIVYALRLPC